MRTVVDEILAELTNLANYIQPAQMDEMCELLCDVQKRHAHIFVAGAGRSGCVARGFANRLLHLGFEVSLLGEITTPPIRKGDVFFAISGSGRTTSLVKMVEKSIACEADVFTITLNGEGDIAKVAKATIILPGNTRLSQGHDFVSRQPVGTNFEQLAWLTCDALVMMVRDALQITNEDLIHNHANLE